MGLAKAINLHIRASQSAQLCFEVSGILGELNVELGSPVTAFDYPAFHALLGSIPTVPGHPARMIFDFLEIQAAVKPSTLASLRAEAAKSSLNKAINGRANAFYAKYADAPAVIKKMRSFYSPNLSGSKPNRLDVLASFSQQQMEQLRDAYIADNRTGVVRNTGSAIASHTVTNSDVETSSFNRNPGIVSEPAEGVVSSTKHKADLAQGKDIADQTETVTNTDYGYRTPFLDNLAQYERAQISLIDEQFAQFMASQSLPYLEAIFRNELQSIDGDVFRAQIAYLATILLSPIGGTVTGLYKYPGEAIKAGEPVLRVENEAEILIVARLSYRGAIAAGATMTVETRLFDVAGPATSISGPIVSVRGLEADELWEVVAKCPNLDGGGAAIFPFGYHFDYDNTSVTIS